MRNNIDVVNKMKKRRAYMYEYIVSYVRPITTLIRKMNDE
jgi:hypothetical protein